MAALVRSAYPDLNPEQVAERLERTADNPPEGHNADIGYGWSTRTGRCRACSAPARTRPPAQFRHPGERRPAGVAALRRDLGGRDRWAAHPAAADRATDPGPRPPTRLAPRPAHRLTGCRLTGWWLSG
ncbi:hypothetical protein NKG94_32230 [Micromonospora sp. M12]